MRNGAPIAEDGADAAFPRRRLSWREKLIRRIVSVDEEFPGERRRFLPDLILEWGPEAPVHRISSPEIGEIEVSLATGRGGNHNASAFLVAKGGEAFIDVIEPVRDIADLGAAAEAFLSPLSGIYRNAAFAAQHSLA